MFPGYSNARKHRQAPRVETAEDGEIFDGEIIDEDGEILTASQKKAKDIRLRNKRDFDLVITEKKVTHIKEKTSNRRVGQCSSEEDSDTPQPSVEKSDFEKNQCAEDRKLLEKECVFNTQKNPPSKAPATTKTFSSFPSSKENDKTEHIVKKEKKDDYKSSTAKKKKKRRYRSRSRSRSSSRSKFRKKKSKRHRKRYNSSSSSSSSSRSSRSSSSRRSRSPTSKRRRSEKEPREKTNSKSQKERWSFTTFEESLQFDRYILFCKDEDYGNFTMDFPKNEKATVNYIYNSVLGTCDRVINQWYSESCSGGMSDMKKIKREKPFHEKLKSIAMHAPRENEFRRKAWDALSSRGFVPLSKESLQDASAEKRSHEQALNTEITRRNVEDEMAGNVHQLLSDTVLQSITDLETRNSLYSVHLTQYPHDIEKWIRFVDLQDQIYEAKRPFQIRDTRLAVLQRKEAILEKASKKNPRYVLFHIMRIDVSIEMKKDPEVIVLELKTLTHAFPHEKIAWNRYLDYVQFNGQVYTYERMRTAYVLCMEKVRNLVEGNLRSHVALIDDFPAFRKFQLYIYVRYWKWLMAAGFAPKAIADIQATLEVNFGFERGFVLKNHQRRMDELKTFWDMKMPRIGDHGARGAALEMQRFKEMSENDRAYLEFADYDVSLYATKLAIKNCLERSDRSLGKNWTDFERKMEDIEARVKRNPIELYNQEYGDDLETVELWREIEFEDLRVYFHPPDEKSFDFVQPILELLGMKFVTTSGYWSKSEDIIEEWKLDGYLDFENKAKFDSVPTYSENFCAKFSRNVVDYLLKYHYPIKESGSPSSTTVNLMASLVLSKASEMEKQFEAEKIEMWKISPKTLTDLLKGSLDSSVLSENKRFYDILTMIGIQKFIEWHKAARQNLEEIEREILKCDRKKIFTTLYLDPDDKKRITLKIPKQINKYLQATSTQLWVPGAPSKWSDDLPLTTIQLQLFSLLLRLNIVPTKESQFIQNLLFTQILEKDISEMDEKGSDHLELHIIEMCTKLGERENNEEKTSWYHILPCPSMICMCLALISHFTQVGSGGSKKRVSSYLEDVQQAAKLTTRSNEYEQRNVKLLIDTFINLLGETRERKLTYFETYKSMLRFAHEQFPSDSRYAKRLVEESVNCTAKKIELQKILILEKNQNQNAKRLGFDMKRDTISLVLALSSMYSSLRLFEKIDSSYSIESLVKVFQTEAAAVNDPSLWRLVIRLASKVNDRSKTIDKVHTLANGQCGWSKNIHLDRVEGETSSDDGELTNNIMSLISEKTRGAPHSMFLHGTDLLAAHQAPMAIPSNPE